jgi:hypothetical protein
LNFELLIIGILPIVIGNIQLQHMSVIGFKNLPVHFPPSPDAISVFPEKLNNSAIKNIKTSFFIFYPPT